VKKGIVDEGAIEPEYPGLHVHPETTSVPSTTTAPCFLFTAAQLTIIQLCVFDSPKVPKAAAADPLTADVVAEHIASPDPEYPASHSTAILSDAKPVMLLSNALLELGTSVGTQGLNHVSKFEQSYSKSFFVVLMPHSPPSLRLQ